MNFKYSLVVAILLTCTYNLSAQVAGTSIFLQGNYVEIAINECGVYGSNEDTPEGPFGDYHGTNINGLGYIADHEKDGWDVSTEPGQPVFCGDYFTPGSPEEGWAIQVGESVYENHSTYCNPYGGYWFDSLPDMPGENVLYTDSAGVKTAVWEGTLTQDSLSLFIRQTTILPDTALFFISEMEITNTGTEDLVDVYYIRNVDPDQDLDNCGTFMTHNTIESNTPASDTAFVSAVGGACGCYFGTIAVDPRARVSYGAFFLTPYKPSDAYDGLEAYSIEGDLLCDCAVQITYKFDLAAGETTTLSYARLFDAADVDIAVEVLEENAAPNILVDGVEISSEDELLICEGQSTAISVEGLSGYEWSWEPTEFLDVATGTDVVSTPSEDITYIVTGTNGTETVTASVNIVVSKTMELYVESSPSVDGTATGSASVSVTDGGIAPFTYLWSTGEETEMITGLEPGTYSVNVTDAAGCTSTKTVDVSVANNLSDISMDQVFQIYPNPASSSVTIDLTSIAGLQNQIQITSMNGAIIWETANASTSMIQIDVTAWPAGIYFLQVNNEAGSFVQQLSVE